MGDYRELFKREVERLSYLYAKANTKSKKKQLAYDLIFFEDMYNGLSEKEKVVFPWTNDQVLMDIKYEVTQDIVQSVLDDQNFIIKLAENSFNIFLQNEFSVHGDYGKKYHKATGLLIQNTIRGSFDRIDQNLISRFNKKFENAELFKNNNSRASGLFFPMESLNKNVIFVAMEDVPCVEDGRILSHEMGHEFEFENASKNGVNSIWNGIVRTIYPEVSSCFFEYAYINYLIENNICKDDAMILKRRYLNQIYYFFCYLLIIVSHRNLHVDPSFCITLDNKEIIDYGNELLEMMNSSDDLFKMGDKINFRTPFVYGMGKLLGVYIYDAYKNNPKEFLTNFKTALLQYKNVGIDAFSSLGITRDSLLQGNVLKRTLKDCK